jgi:hypothetical protein
MKYSKNEIGVVVKMRRYDLYIIDDQFINYYYGRERIFYNLFKDYEKANASLKKVLYKQIDYITKTMPVLRIHKQLIQLLSKHKDYYMKDGVYCLENKTSSARLTLQNKRCILYATGSIHAEMIFFEALRKVDLNFLAIDIENERFGWIKPMKEKHYI